MARTESAGGQDMMIDDDTLKQLLRIDDELMLLCKWLNEKRDTGNFVSPHPSRERPHAYFVRLS
jgi:hypothetical protein